MKNFTTLICPLISIEVTIGNPNTMVANFLQLIQYCLLIKHSNIKGKVSNKL